MEGGIGLVKFLVPQIPSLASTAAWHTLGMTPTSSQWDLRTTLTVQVLRRMMSSSTGSKPQSIGKVQATTLKDPGVKGKMWVATETIRAPSPGEEGLREAVFAAIEALKPEDAGELRYQDPGLSDTEVEWTGYRPDAGKEDKMPDISEEEKYKRLVDEPCRTSDTTILYFHGGAYYLCDPVTHRAIASRLAKDTNGRVCNVRYRLAPQTAFPGQLLDALLVYLSLLYPPPNSMHTAVPAGEIVFAGDSAGGNLSFALLQLLLQLNRSPSTSHLLFHGRQVSAPLPAGCLANSGWFDISRSMPSVTTNTSYDYLPPANHDNPLSPIKHDEYWPRTPPRGDIFTDLSLLDHPLVSPLAALDWTGAPPLWLCTGQECLTDEDCIVASRAASQGVAVQFEMYEAMPHVFAMLLPFLPTAERCLNSKAAFVRRCVEEPDTARGDGTKGVFVKVKTGEEESLDVGKVAALTVEEARKLMRVSKERRVKGYEAVAVPRPAL